MYYICFAGSEAQKEEMGEGLKEINTPYAHEESTAIKLMAVPESVTWPGAQTHMPHLLYVSTSGLSMFCLAPQKMVTTLSCRLGGIRVQLA